MLLAIEIHEKEDHHTSFAHFLTGTFILFTGITELLLIWFNESYVNGDERSKIPMTVLESLLILWTGSGLWTTLYGKFCPCEGNATEGGDEFENNAPEDN
jgi:hypothetical protein